MIDTVRNFHPRAWEQALLAEVRQRCLGAAYGGRRPRAIVEDVRLERTYPETRLVVELSNGTDRGVHVRPLYEPAWLFCPDGRLPSISFMVTGLDVYLTENIAFILNRTWPWQHGLARYALERVSRDILSPVTDKAVVGVVVEGEGVRVTFEDSTIHIPSVADGAFRSLVDMCVELGRHVDIESYEWPFAVLQ